ncbi:hypothetical protein [Enterovibrio norvegicus]|uniref:hypothetical protein n=1 Tax=Enterovibrio norvegicus TaxID=188144 RepID=UPI00352D977F
MKLNKSTASVNDVNRVRRAITFCQKHELNFNGFPFDDPLVSSAGIGLELYVPQGTEDHEILEGIRQAKYERDVVSHAVLVCPPAWFAEN